MMEDPGSDIALNELSLRQEIPQDREEVNELIRQAFTKSDLGYDGEAELVDRLRSSEEFIPELSLIAKNNEKILGYILLTKIHIKSKHHTEASLALAPVCVLPSAQNKGIGAALIQKAHEIAQEMAYKSVILIGHANYYPRFGYKPLSTFNITLPFEVPHENCMAIELQKNGLQGIHGRVEYASAFFE